MSNSASIKVSLNKQFVEIDRESLLLFIKGKWANCGNGQSVSDESFNQWVSNIHSFSFTRVTQEDLEKHPEVEAEIGEWHCVASELILITEEVARTFYEFFPTPKSGYGDFETISTLVQWWVIYSALMALNQSDKAAA